MLGLILAAWTAGEPKIVTETMHCDTFEQSVEILEDYQESLEKVRDTYTRLVNTPNQFGQPSCFYHVRGESAMKIVPLETVGRFDDIANTKGESFTIYLIKAKWPFGNGDWLIGYFWSDQPVLKGEPA